MDWTLPPAVVTILGYAGMAFGLVMFVILLAFAVGKFFGAWMESWW